VSFAKPFRDNLKRVGIWIVEARKSKLSCNPFVRFFESSVVACVYPKYLSLRVVITISIAVLDCNLRFPVMNVIHS
jgi:hypothetical protein